MGEAIRRAAVVGALLLAACGASTNVGDDGGAAPDAAVTPQCASDQDCTAPDRPICGPDAVCEGCIEDGQCVALDPLAPLCAADGACVGCRGAADCTSVATPVCDADSRRCRACSADAECASGVCDLAEGTCFATTDVYVVDDGASCGSGDGSSGAPYCSIAEALAAFAADAAPRNFIAVRDGQYTFPALATAPLPGFIGTAGAQIGPATPGGDCLSLTTSARLQLRGFRFSGCAVALRLAATATQVSLTDTLIDNSQTGVECRAHLCLVTHVQVADSKTGLLCADGARCTVQDSSVAGGDFGVIASNAQLQLLDSNVTGSRLTGLALTASEIEVRHVTVKGVGVGGTGASAGVNCVNGYCVLQRLRVTGSRGAGLVLSNSSFDVSSSAILGNGSDDASLAQNGGVVISQPGTMKVFQNNTVVGNRAAGSATAGVRCAAAMALRNSIIWGNSGAPLDAACTASYSDIDTAAAVQPGVGNLRVDPRVTSTTPGAMDEHLESGSPCIDSGDPAGGAAADIDGEARPRGLRVDIGADETGAP